MTRGDTATMSADWLPAFAAGTIGSIGAWLLSWRIASAKAEGKGDADEKRADELRTADGKRADELRTADAKRADDLRQDLRELKEDWRAGIDQVQRLSDDMARLQSAQNVVNGMQAKALEGLCAKQDQHADKLADHASTLKLVTGMVAMLQQRVDAQDKRVGFEK